MDKDKVYLGDAVYASHDDWHIILTTGEGIGPANKIFLDPDVFKALVRYREVVFNPKPVEGN